MDILKIKEKQLSSEIKKSIDFGLHRILCVIVEEPIVGTKNHAYLDHELCSELGYNICQAYYNGGTLVANKGDIAFVHFGQVKNGWLRLFIEYFVEWLRAMGLNAEAVDNDVLVDGYKVCGTTITRYGRVDFSAAFISVNCNLNDIKAICTKPMEKIPKGLSEYGITTDQIEEMFLDFCRNNE